MSRKLRIQFLLMDNLIWVMVVLFLVVNAFTTPRFATCTNLINILYHSTIMGLLVLAQGLVLVVGHLDLSLDSTLAFAPAIAMLLSTRWVPGGLGPVTTLLITLLVGTAIGLFNGYCVAVVRVNSFLQTLSMMIILRGLVLFLVPFAIFPLNPVYAYAGRGKLAGIPVAIILMLLVFALFQLILKGTVFGRRLMATGGNPRASFIAGVDPKRMVVYAYALAGLLAALAGLLVAGRQDSVSNTMGGGMVLLAFAGAILGGVSLDGGRGTPAGMLGGVVLLGMISNSLNLLGVPVTLVSASQGALVFVAILLDRVKENVRYYLLHQEQRRKLLAQGGGGGGGHSRVTSVCTRWSDI